jgi:hypothetical protein
MAYAHDGGSAAEAHQSRCTGWFALGEVALLWMGALVGPMLVVSAVAGAARGVAVGVIVGLALFGLLLVIAVLLRRSPLPKMAGAAPRKVTR